MFPKLWSDMVKMQCLNCRKREENGKKETKNTELGVCQRALEQRGFAYYNMKHVTTVNPAGLPPVAYREKAAAKKVLLKYIWDV